MFDSLTTSSISQRWQQQSHPMPVVVAIISRNTSEVSDDSCQKSYLLIRRNQEPYQQAWALVGGKWDFGETMAQAVEREVREETSLETKFVSLKAVVSERLVPPTIEKGRSAHFLLFVCQLEAIYGQAVEKSEGKVAWFTVNEIENLQSTGTIIPSDYLMLKKFRGSTVLTYHEADMVSGGVKPTSKLARFDQID